MCACVPDLRCVKVRSRWYTRTVVHSMLVLCKTSIRVPKIGPSGSLQDTAWGAGNPRPNLGSFFVINWQTALDPARDKTYSVLEGWVHRWNRRCDGLTHIAGFGKKKLVCPLSGESTRSSDCRWRGVPAEVCWVNS